MNTFIYALCLIFASSITAYSQNENFEKPAAEVLKKTLTPEQYRCTQEAGTERPFHNAYWNNKEDGIYVDIVSGEPLFSSLDKYDSGTGWPSFTQPIEDGHLDLHDDNKLGYTRTEVKSKLAGSHLGHLFDDGPRDKGGKRYCMNSAALNFIPLEQLQEKGYGRYLFSFAKKKGWSILSIKSACAPEKLPAEVLQVRKQDQSIEVLYNSKRITGTSLKKTLESSLKDRRPASCK